jgi:hypothetical protein
MFVLTGLDVELFLILDADTKQTVALPINISNAVVGHDQVR